jgi:hypothetical protein
LESSLASLIAFLGLGSLTLGVAILLLVLVLAVLPLLYLLPTLVALQRRKRNALSILMVNLYLGWTLIGWVAAIVWAYSVDRDQF